MTMGWGRGECSCESGVLQVHPSCVRVASEGGRYAGRFARRVHLKVDATRGAMHILGNEKGGSLKSRPFVG